MSKDKVRQLIEQAAAEKWERLELSHSHLTELPPEIGQLTDLLSLGLYHNQLTTLPPEIGQLSNLSTLYLGSNHLVDLPPEIGRLTKLSTLDVSNNQLAKFPAEIGQLTHLLSLVAYNNHLAELPPEIGQLTQLTMFNLSNNRLAELPAAIGQLSKLALFNLSNNQLATLLPEIGRLLTLSVLDLSNNQLTQIPPQIGQLVNLLSLVLHNNQLTEIPSSIGWLAKLSSLDLSNNALHTLPQEISQLTRLSICDVSDNQLTELPTQVGQLANLAKFYLSRNNLVQLPPELGRLVRLSSFDLSHNQLTEIPPEIGSLVSLSKFYLNNNNLKTLPLEIGRLFNLALFDIRENALPIPPEIISQTNRPATIVHYYLEYRASLEHKPLNEAKILLVGQSYVGKTSLVRRLLKDEFDPYQTKTEGIDIHKWNMTINNQTVRLNVWDFGGQEIMHATHQFFLTQRSLYLLILNARQDEYDNRIEYWLKIIQSFGGSSPIIIVVNKCDQERLPNIDRRGLEVKYPNIKGFINTSCKTREGIDQLTELIMTEVSQLEHVHDLLPARWFDLKAELEALEMDFITYAKYQELCQKQGIIDERSQELIIGFLHDLGVMLNFRTDSRLLDTNILNPEWVTDGVYKILNYNALFHTKGVLDSKMLTQILDSPRYPKEKHLFIMDMMRKFELCFEFDGGDDKYFLIPDLLPKEEPYTGEWPEQDCLGFQYHYNVLPGGVMSRFIVRMHQWIYQKTYWHNGVVLGRGRNKALVKADLEERKIFITINGRSSTRRELLAIIRSEFSSIHRTISKLEAKEKVPLPHHPEIAIDYQHLLTLEEMGKARFVPEGLSQEINIKILLNGIEPEIDRQGRRPTYTSLEKSDDLPPINSSTGVPDLVGPQELWEVLDKSKSYLDRAAQQYVDWLVRWLGTGVLALWLVLGVMVYRVIGSSVWPGIYFSCLLMPVAGYLMIMLIQGQALPPAVRERLIDAKKKENYSEFGVNFKSYQKTSPTTQEDNPTNPHRSYSSVGKSSAPITARDRRRLIELKTRRLQKLKEQQARQGFQTNPDILMEIEDVETELEQLELPEKENEAPRTN